MEGLVLATVRRCVVNNWDTLRETNFQSCKNSLRNWISKNVSSFDFLPQFIKTGCQKRADKYSTYLIIVKIEPMGNKMVYLILNTTFQHTLMKPRQLCKVDICAHSFEWKFTYMKALKLEHNLAHCRN